MTDSEKLDVLMADVAFLRKFVEGLGMGGPRVRPGDGSTSGSTLPITVPPAEPTNPIERPSNPFLDAYRQSNPIGDGGSPGTPNAPASRGTADPTDSPTFDHSGATRRYVGSRTRTYKAERDGVVSFSVGESGGNNATSWQITVSVNGTDRFHVTTDRYVVTDAVPVKAGDVVALTLSGTGIVLSARVDLQ